MWNEIRAIPGCKSVRLPGSYGEMFLLPVPPDETSEPSHWMIGQYKDQTGLATALRTSEPLQKFVTDWRVRFGLRATDRPPVDVARQARYGATKAGAHPLTNFGGQRVRELAKPVFDGQPTTNRRGDRQENVRTFWATQTPQSHHVVEFNHLRDIGVNRENGNGEMDHGQLPCVLLAAEFHQRYISSILKQTHGWSADRLRKELGQAYASLYLGRGPLFRPLWDVSRIILRAVGIPIL
ncbi:MAG: hypothetical protein ABI318_08950 [Chthoniobacteraceae bacterium]